METFDQYIEKNESAVRVLFDGIQSYISELRTAKPQVFIAGHLDPDRLEVEYAEWERQNRTAISAYREAEHKYFSQVFANAVLCGAVLQIAAKAIELYSRNSAVPEDIIPFITIERRGEKKINERLYRFCIGRRVRDVPVGLIIYAARNQHTHFEEHKLKEQVNFLVFESLAYYVEGMNGKDPCFDLSNDRLVSYAHNITALFGWHSYDSYVADLRAMLGG